MVLHHFEYTAEMCDCRYCPYYRGKRKCTADSCPCIEERILAGAASRSEVMSETMKDIHNAAFRKRLIQFIRESEELPMNFRNEKHRLAFDEAIRKLNKKNFALMSALYLLTAEHKFTPESRNGEVKVTFTFDAHDFTTSTKLVVFESLYREDVEITTHKDIEDKDQTVTITPPPDVPQTGDNSKLGIWIGLGGIALGGAVACIVLYFKKKEEDEK